MIHASTRPQDAEELAPAKPPLKRVELDALCSQPLVSIVVPSFNQGRFIRETIDSILSQDYRPLEIHVIDGGSRDETVDVLKSYGEIPELHWVSEKDRGVVHAVNKGFARVNGEIIGIQSSDDTYLPGAISFMVDAFHQRPLHGLLYADIETISAEADLLRSSNIGEYSLTNFLSKRTWIPQPSAFFRRAMLESCGGWDERYFNADTELWLRMVFRTQVEKLDGSIAQRRLHDDQRNHQAAKIADGYRRMILDSADIRQSDSRIRRAARAGIHVHSIRYNASNSHLVASYHLWMALVKDPSLWATFRSSPLLVPGWLSFRSLMSKMKRGIVGVGSR